MVTLRVMNGETESWAIEGVGGGDIPGLAIPAFTLRRPAGAPIPVVIAAPHGGRAYPEALTDRMRDPAFASLRLEDRHVDRMADAVAAATGAALLVAATVMTLAFILTRLSGDLAISIAGPNATAADIEAVRKTLGEVGKEVACIIVEPVAGNMNCVPPAPGFLEGLRRLCDAHGVVLIFDEVMTGFRVALGGAQAYYGVTPDLSTFGKIIGGGMPVGCFGGKRAIMERIAPLGPVYQAGTLSGNPLAMAAGLTTLELISRPGFHDELGAYTSRMLQGLQDRADAAGIPFVTTQVGGMFGLYFSGADDIVTFADVMASDADRFKRFFHLMLEGGVYLAPSAFEAGFTSIAHGDKELAITLDAAERAFAKLK